MILLKTILFSMALILVGAALFAISSKLVGREEKAHGCGLEGSCESCGIRLRSEDSSACPLPPEKRAETGDTTSTGRIRKP